MKSERNKTILLSAEQARDYAARCLNVSKMVDITKISDATICGDCFAVLPLLPSLFADLVIADPP